MVLRNSEVIVEIQSRSQATRLRKILEPTPSELRSPEFTNKVTNLAKNLSGARKGMSNLRNFLK
ncbi:hypothetical protein I6J31_08310 [Leuconostoc falkenbergense]|nr:hypothetical protein I6J31_08310 [Leuconostoc falkenbergense]